MILTYGGIRADSIKYNGEFGIEFDETESNKENGRAVKSSEDVIRVTKSSDGKCINVEMFE